MGATAITSFFALWGEPDPDARLAGLRGLLAPDFRYTDPRTEAPIASAEEMAAFLSAFSANAPDATAEVAEPVDLHHGQGRATVRFARGGAVFATGQYFFEMAGDDRLGRVAGFMGKGPE